MPGKFRKIYEKHIFAIGLHIPLSLSPLVPIVAQAHAPYLLPLLLLLLPSKSIHAFLLPTSLPGHHCFPSITALCATPLSKLPSVGPSFYDDVRKQGELLMLSLSPFIPLLFLVSFPPSLPDPAHPPLYTKNSHRRRPSGPQRRARTTRDRVPNQPGQNRCVVRRIFR